MGGNTAMHMGAEYDYYTIVKILMANGADQTITNEAGSKAIEGLEGGKTGPEAWDNPVTILKTVLDDKAALEDVFQRLEAAKVGEIKKDDLVRIGMAKKKELKEWTAGGFQARFADLVKKH